MEGGAEKTVEGGVEKTVELAYSGAIYCAGRVLCVLAALAVFGLILNTVPFTDDPPSFRNSLLFSSTGSLIEGHEFYLASTHPPPSPPFF